MKTLERSVLKLKTITYITIRQGLLNAIGSISKTLFGTLDDAELRINRNRQTLQRPKQIDTHRSKPNFKVQTDPTK